VNRKPRSGIEPKGGSEAAARAAESDDDEARFRETLSRMARKPPRLEPQKRKRETTKPAK